jgi:threonine/homoserine/homoserine lactone efflux protein
VAQQRWLSLFGGLFLCYLGLRTFFSPPAQSAAPAQTKGLLRNYLSIFFLTLTNPITILSFAAIFAGLGLAENADDYASAGLLVLGVFSGSALWWLMLSMGVSLFRERVTSLWMLWINRFSGGIVFAFGIAALVNYLSQV